MYGPAGEYVLAVEPHTEADPAAILVQLLTAFGNASGRNRYMVADGSWHYPNEFALVVGATSKARKGTSWSRVVPVLTGSAADWYAGRVKSGLSSGEGIIHHVRDPAPAKVKNGKAGDPDPGELDKRLLCTESEFGSVLDRAGRDGNSLSAVVRQAWDGGTLSTLTKGDPARATGAHVSIIGHVTAEELKKKLTASDAANGFGNRFLFVHAARSRLLPFGAELPSHLLDQAVAKFRAAVAFAGTPGRVEFALDARPVWESLYTGPLAVERPGLAGKLTDRGPAHILRVALIYAMLDKSDTVRRKHLEAAAAVWAYSETTVEYVFGYVPADPLAAKVFGLLDAAANGLTRTELNNRLGGHAKADALAAALDALARDGKARRQSVPTDGRPAERWHAVADRGPSFASSASSAGPTEPSPGSSSASSASSAATSRHAPTSASDEYKNAAEKKSSDLRRSSEQLTASDAEEAEEAEQGYRGPNSGDAEEAEEADHAPAGQPSPTPLAASIHPGPAAPPASGRATSIPAPARPVRAINPDDRTGRRTP